MYALFLPIVYFKWPGESIKLLTLMMPKILTLDSKATISNGANEKWQMREFITLGVLEDADGDRWDIAVQKIGRKASSLSRRGSSLSLQLRIIFFKFSVREKPTYTRWQLTSYWHKQLEMP